MGPAQPGARKHETATAFLARAASGHGPAAALAPEVDKNNETAAALLEQVLNWRGVATRAPPRPATPEIGTPAAPASLPAACAGTKSELSGHGEAPYESTRQCRRLRRRLIQARSWNLMAAAKHRTRALQQRRHLRRRLVRGRRRSLVAAAKHRAGEETRR